MLQKCTRWP